MHGRLIRHASIGELWIMIVVKPEDGDALVGIRVDAATYAGSADTPGPAHGAAPSRRMIIGSLAGLLGRTLSARVGHLLAPSRVRR